VVPPASIPFFAPADTAQAVATVYTVSLLATLPIAAAGIAVVALRRAGAEARLLALRAAGFALLIAFIGRQLPLHWLEWVLPAPLTTPLVALGRVQVTQGGSASGASNTVATVVALAFMVYVAGALLTLAPMLAGSLRVRLLARRARTLHVIGRVRVLVSDQASVPMTWGVLRPVVMLPSAALSWPAEQRRITLIHELAHVRAGDWVFGVLARLTCALYWCHPGAWWLARAMNEECELACDERVIASGVRRSDYAELLVCAADQLLPAGAVGLSSANGLRARLAAIVGSAGVRAPLARRWVFAAAASAVVIAAPTSTVQLAPTRDVLTSLVRDTRWESRAYAVVGLARRADPDSVAVARAIAEGDPDPQVRAWARAALRERGTTAELRAILRQ
jgi:beta-lactamase regulating signal transducer with metallopeptidase domain